MSKKPIFSEESRKKLGDTARSTVKKRRAFMQEMTPHLRKWKKDAEPNNCVVCGENMVIVLDKHHLDPTLRRTKEYNSPDNIVQLCASCHRIFDKKDGSVKHFLKRHRRLHND